MAKIRPKKALVLVLIGNGSHYNLIGHGTTFFFQSLAQVYPVDPIYFICTYCNTWASLATQVPNNLFILGFKICQVSF